MALDFHFALGKKEAIYQKPNISIDSVLHTTIFGRGIINIDMFPMFRRMASYYEDATYNTRELKLLNSEIKNIKQIFNENVAVTNFLESFSKLNTIAQEKKLILWIFCD